MLEKHACRESRGAELRLNQPRHALKQSGLSGKEHSNTHTHTHKTNAHSMTWHGLTDATKHKLEDSRTLSQADTLINHTHIRSTLSTQQHTLDHITGLTVASSHRLYECRSWLRRAQRPHRIPSFRHGHYETRILKQKALADSEQNNLVS